MSSSDNRRREVTEQMWYAAEDCSRSIHRRLEKLGLRRLRVGYGNRQFVKQSRTQTPSKLRLCWMMKFVSEPICTIHAGYTLKCKFVTSNNKQYPLRTSETGVYWRVYDSHTKVTTSTNSCEFESTNKSVHSPRTLTAERPRILISDNKLATRIWRSAVRGLSALNLGRPAYWQWHTVCHGDLVNKSEWSFVNQNFCRAMPCKRGLCYRAVRVCLCVCHVREFCQNE